MRQAPARNELRTLDPRRVKLRLDPYDRLHLEIGIEERYGPVRAVDCLPLTRPREFISIQDDEGDEIGIIPGLGELDAESRRAVEHDLQLYYLMAVVQGIRKVESRNGVISWELDTDLGPKTAHIRDRTNIRAMPDGRTILTDIHEGKYLVPPTEQLDERSRHWLEIEL